MLGGQGQAKGHRCPKPPAPTGTAGVGLGLMHSGSGPSTSQHLLPASSGVPGLTEFYALAAPASPCQPLPCCQAYVPGKRLCSSEGMDLPVPTHPVLIFLGKINSPNMSALR